MPEIFVTLEARGNALCLQAAEQREAVVDADGTVIDAVNQVGSYFYGSLLGVFILAFASKRANGHGATAGLLLGMATVLTVTLLTDLGFLWWNTLGTTAAVTGGWLVSLATGSRAGP